MNGIKRKSRTALRHFVKNGTWASRASRKRAVLSWRHMKKYQPNHPATRVYGVMYGFIARPRPLALDRNRKYPRRWTLPGRKVKMNRPLVFCRWGDIPVIWGWEEAAERFQDATRLGTDECCIDVAKLQERANDPLAPDL